MALTADSKKLYIDLPNIEAKHMQDAEGEYYRLTPQGFRAITDTFYSLAKKIQGNLTLSDLTSLAVSELKAGTVISNTVITNEMYSTYGNVSNLAVNKLRTDYEKATKFLSSDTSDVNYINIHDETISFITAKVCTGTTQLEDNGKKFYWTDDTHTQMTSEKTTDYPVTIYNYVETVKANISFKTVALPDNGSTVMPVFTLGAGTGVGDNGKAFIYKGIDGLLIDYTTASGTTTSVKLTDFVDADMRRIKSAAINKSAGTIAVTMEGESSATTLNYTETTTSMTFTWPDGHAATISIN